MPSRTLLPATSKWRSVMIRISFECVSAMMARGSTQRFLRPADNLDTWGISGMRERAQRIGARLDFWSEMGAGTEVQLTVPAAMAYEKRRHNRRFRLFRRAGSDE